MIERTNPLANLELFEELNDQFSEKISGGEGLTLEFLFIIAILIHLLLKPLNN